MATRKRTIQYFVMLVLALSGCAKTSRIVTATPPPSDATWLEKRPVKPFPELQPLVAAVESLVIVPGNRSHSNVVAALRALADTVGALQPVRGDRIDVAASRLEQSETTDPRHVEHVTTALDEAIGAVESELGRANAAAREAYVAAVSARDAIEPVQPLLEQHARIQLAFAAIANTIATSRSLPPPFADVTIGEHRPDLEAFLEHCRAASRAVGDLATTRSWGKARRQTAAVLHALARAVSTAPTASRDPSDIAMIIRYQALRLERAGVVDSRGVGWTRTGLLAAVDGLDRMAARSAVAARLSADARQAVEQLRTDGMFPFQRPAMQDALRAVVSAYVATAAHEQQQADR